MIRLYKKMILDFPGLFLHADASMEPYLPYAHQIIEEDDITAVAEAMRGSVVTRGPCVEKFEESVARYCQVRYAVAFNSASTGLAASCFAAKLSPADRFLTTPNTFIASSGSAKQMGVAPIYIDIDRQTGNCDFDLLTHNLNQDNSRGRDIVMMVHFSGIPFDMARLDKEIRRTDTVVIEDAAHALGASYTDGQKVGCCAWSQMTVFSFHPAKTVTTGEGGVVTTNDEALYERLRLYRNNGIVAQGPQLLGVPAPGYYEVHALTGNFNVSELQGALGASQMLKVDRFIQKRRELVAHYRALLSSVEHLQMFNPHFDSQSAHHLFVVQIDFDAYKKNRVEVMQELHKRGIGTQVHYIPLYRHPVFAKQHVELASYFPQTEGYYKQALTLPLFPSMSLADVERVVKTLQECLKKES